jgi:hypothetical protein
MKVGDLVSREEDNLGMKFGVVVVYDNGFVKVLWLDGRADYNHCKNLEVVSESR